MQKDSSIKKPDCTSQIPFSVMPCPICALKVALNMLKLPLRATLLPIRLALSSLLGYLNQTVTILIYCKIARQWLCQ